MDLFSHSTRLKRHSTQMEGGYHSEILIPRQISDIVWIASTISPIVNSVSGRTLP